MKTLNGFANKLSDESGQITLDFVFAVGIAFGFTVLFFAMSYTLSMVEVCQYITYSASRTFYAANSTRQAQIALGEQKFAELKARGIFKTILTNGWITLTDIKFDDFSSDYNDTTAGADATFIGGQAKFKANVLDLHLPFVGNSLTSKNGAGSATLNAYLLREVSTEECVQGFANQRIQQMQNVVDGARYAPYLKNGVVIRDNGC